MIDSQLLEMNKLINEAQGMIFKSKSPLMDNSHELDIYKLEKLIRELGIRLSYLRQEIAKKESIKL